MPQTSAQSVLDEQILRRFGGIARLYGEAGLVRLQNSSVLVVGIGGVGSWVVEALARSGVGRLLLVDLDEVCVSNTNRQIHSLEGMVGQSKVSVMATRCKAINPQIEVVQIEEWLTPENTPEFFEKYGEVHGVVDAIDTVNSKASLIAYCKKAKIPIITVGGAGGQLDPSQIQISDLTQTVHDPLASKVRQKLRQNYGFAKGGKNKFGVPCVFSTEHLLYPSEDGIPCHIKPEGNLATRLDCASGFGAITHVTCTFGMFASGWILNKLATKSNES